MHDLQGGDPPPVRVHGDVEVLRLSFRPEECLQIREADHHHPQLAGLDVAVALPGQAVQERLRADVDADGPGQKHLREALRENVQDRVPDELHVPPRLDGQKRPLERGLPRCLLDLADAVLVQPDARRAQLEQGAQGKVRVSLRVGLEVAEREVDLLGELVAFPVPTTAEPDDADTGPSEDQERKLPVLHEAQALQHTHRVPPRSRCSCRRRSRSLSPKRRPTRPRPGRRPARRSPPDAPAGPSAGGQ